MVDLKRHEIIILWSIAIPSIFFGFYPHPIIITIDNSVTNLIDIYSNNLQIFLANKQ